MTAPGIQAFDGLAKTSGTTVGELIIMIVFLPILTLEGVEGKMFRPMALTMIFALVGSLVLSLTLMPVLASLFLPKRINEKEPWLVRQAHRSLMFFSSSACSSEARQQRFIPAQAAARGGVTVCSGVALRWSTPGIIQRSHPS